MKHIYIYTTKELHDLLYYVFRNETFRIKQVASNTSV